MNSNKLAGMIAASATALALSSAAIAADKPLPKQIGANDTVKCYGVNSCKGTADCKTTEHECKGMNTCKGQGFKALAAGQCLKRGGTIGDIG